jgi:hypothetical protein
MVISASTCFLQTLMPLAQRIEKGPGYSPAVGDAQLDFRLV